MTRTVIVLLLVAIGCYEWIAAYAVAFALSAWHDLAALALDPGRLSPVAVGGALILLCAAVLFRHVTAWVLTCAALISTPGRGLRRRRGDHRVLQTRRSHRGRGTAKLIRGEAGAPVRGQGAPAQAVGSPAARPMPCSR